MDRGGGPHAGDARAIAVDVARATWRGGAWVATVALIASCHPTKPYVGLDPSLMPRASPRPNTPVPSMAPDVVIEVAGAQPCAPVRDGLPGQAAPDATWVARLVERPWCRGDDAGGWVREELAADGTFGTWPGVAPGGAPSNCWALSGDVLFVYSGAGTQWWGGRLREAGENEISWQGHTHTSCPPVPPPRDEVITPGSGGSGSPRDGS